MVWYSQSLQNSNMLNALNSNRSVEEERKVGVTHVPAEAGYGHAARAPAEGARAHAPRAPARRRRRRRSARQLELGAGSLEAAGAAVAVWLRARKPAPGPWSAGCRAVPAASAAEP